MDRLKHNINSFGESIGGSVKNRFHHDFDSDDELISHYRHDIKQTIAGLKYILRQLHRFSDFSLPKMFKAHMKSIESFNKILGYNSLQFDGIDEFYHEFDKIETQQELPTMHPKEKTFEIPILNEQLYNYIITIDKLTLNTLEEWDIFYQENKLRIIEMQGYLRGLLKLIKRRNKKQKKFQSLQHKMDKLMKKMTPLDDKENKQLSIIERDLNNIKKIYGGLHSKLTTILPHAFSFLEEFIDSLTNTILSKQTKTYKSIYDVLDSFVVYYGMASKNELESSENGYEDIINAWESSMTPERLKLESFISIIHDKNPELINTEIDDQDKSLKASKMWNKMTHKITNQKFSLKPNDMTNGLFNGHMVLDPLHAFLQYQDPSMNRSETYHPTKLVNENDVYVTDVHKTNNESIAPPPLPPRSNTSQHIPPSLPTPRIGPLGSLPASPIPSTPVSQFGFDPVRSKSNSLDTDSMSFKSDSLGDDNNKDDDDDDDDDINDSDDDDSESDNRSALPGYAEVSNRYNRRLAKIYNSSKNNIKQVPVTNNNFINKPQRTDAFDNSTSITHKLDEFTKFFNKALTIGDTTKTKREYKTAKHDFHGIQPGDLSFKAGEHIEVMFEFKNSLEVPVEGYWMIGMCGQQQESPRIGFVPSNYF